MKDFKKGDSVIVSDWGCTYTTSERSAEKLGITDNWVYGSNPFLDEWKNHRVTAEVLAVIDSHVGIKYNGQSYIISPPGLELITSMKGFNVGDKVRVLEVGAVTPLKEGDIVTVDRVDSDGEITKIKEANDIQYSYHNSWYELVSNKLVSNKKSFMKSLTPMLKTMLDKKGRTLYKAEFLNGDLELTTEGSTALMTILFEQNKDELVTLAKEKLAEEKE